MMRKFDSYDMEELIATVLINSPYIQIFVIQNKSEMYRITNNYLSFETYYSAYIPYET